MATGKINNNAWKTLVENQHSKTLNFNQPFTEVMVLVSGSSITSNAVVLQVIIPRTNIKVRTSYYSTSTNRMLAQAWIDNGILNVYAEASGSEVTPYFSAYYR